MAVGFDAKMTGGNGGGGTYQYSSVVNTAGSSTGMTVGVGATLLVAILDLGGNNTTPGALACTWNGVSMNLACSIYTTTSIGAGAALFTLVNPASGNKTLAASWTESLGCQFNLSSLSFTGTDTVTGYNSADNVTGIATSGNQSIAVNTDANGATVATINCYSSGLTVNSLTQIFAGSPTNDNGAASYGVGGSGTNTHTFNVTGATAEAWAGIHIIAPNVSLSPPVINRRNVLYFI